MSSGAALIGLPEHYAHILESNDFSYASTLPPAASTNTTLRREPSFTQFPLIPEVEESASAQLTPVQEKDSFASDADLISVGGKSSNLADSSGKSSPQDEPPTPPEPTTTIHSANTRGLVEAESFPSFFEEFKSGAIFSTSEDKFQLAPPVDKPVVRAATKPITPPEPQEVPKSNAAKLRRRSWLPSSGKSTPRNVSPVRQNVIVEQNKALAALEGAPVSSSNKSPESKKLTKRRNSWMPSSKAPAAAPPAEAAKPKMIPRSESDSSRTPSRPSSRRRPLTMSAAAPPVLDPVPQVPVPEVPTSLKAPRAGTLPPLNTEVAQKKPRRLSGMFSGSTTPTTPKRSNEEPRSAGPVSITKSLSVDKLPGLAGSFGSFDKLSTLSSKGSFDTNRMGKSSSSIRRRDEAWGAFKALDADFVKFTGKSSTVKATIVRASLMPFLRVHNNMDVGKLRAEDLEKRTNILNKWWTGLLDMLNGQNNQTISATDRPLILDAISTLMERPEWRAPGSPLASSTINRPQTSSSTDSSTSSDFVAEAIHHNIRNTFVQNLISQMGYVVDKMSLKNTPASIVSFGGKTCAYVFFFCPGAAKFLISLWKPNQVMMRQVLDECGVPRHSIMGAVSTRVVSKFPPHLHELRFMSLTSTLRVLQKASLPPPGTGNLDWTGPWLIKWSGQESDLFYTFVKNYHVLAVDFLPAEAKKVERICAPGLLMVHAQLLANLDATIHRNDAIELYKTDASSITFDDVLADPDASATALPMGPANINRLMAENRIIMLFRDCLSERAFKDRNARHFSAQCFNDVLQAAAKKTSLFNHHACYTLCDFLEEAITIFTRYEGTCARGQTVFDWPFWFNVWRKMVESQNTTTEIRLFSLLYSVWTQITENDNRKLELCNNFLLEPTLFITHFNHWCPMVRGYYMRLLSWRVARFDAQNALPTDTAILAKLMERLSVVWGFFLYSKCGPTSDIPTDYLATPNPPAPGRRLLIIRTDPVVNPNGGVSLSLDDASRPGAGLTRGRRNSWVEKAGGGGEWRPESSESRSSESPEPDDAGSRRWSLLRTVVGANSRSKSQSPSPRARSPAGDNRGRSSPVKQQQPPPPPQQDFLKPPSSEPGVRHHFRQRSGSMPAAPRHRTYCFKFSLEYVDRRFQNSASILLSPPRLPSAAQEHLSGRYNIAAMFNDIRPTRPQIGTPAAEALSYTGRALAEWATVVSECQNFFERRIREGVPSMKLVETPMLGVETFKRPG